MPETISFSKKLALHGWILSLFGLESFEDLAAPLRDEQLEGMGENNVSLFHAELVRSFPDLPELPVELLLRYDQNIVRHTTELNETRLTKGHTTIRWKYFQYLALLFTEIYLDRYFRDPDALKAAIAVSLDRLNENLPKKERVKPFDESEDPAESLNKLAFWMATGSGKTLLMHIHIKQYTQYAREHRGERGINRIILLTPNAGLSNQHLKEFQASGIGADIFDKERLSLYSGHRVEIIEVTKLKDEMGAKTVAVDAFEGNNLVLIDEGHRGAKSGEEGAWMQYRNALCEKGFSFEYSATFSQAIMGNERLTGLYSRGILFDYSYRYFYNDGYGKDYHILNLESEEEAHRKLYLTACLLSFFQQQKLYKDKETSLRPFHIEKPLLVFVGASVNAVQTKNKQKVSDVLEILLFVQDFVKDKKQSVARIRQLLSSGLVSGSGTNILQNRLGYLIESTISPEDAFQGIMELVFNAAGGGVLYLEQLKGASGEIALQIGQDNPPFGVINVGDESSLLNLCTENGFETGERAFTGSLFESINEQSSDINLLIGSRKFTEGWSSWRVSAMGLMNMGTGEGAQIIQLFGRGVRLLGYNKGLKRSDRAILPPDLDKPPFLNFLETLSIYGVHASYLATFRDILEEEGLTGQDSLIDFYLPVIREHSGVGLKTIRLKRKINGVNTDFGDAFRKLGPIPTLGLPDAYLRKHPVTLNWYPRIQAIKGKELKGGDGEAGIHRDSFTEKHLAFIDMEKLYFTLERHKAERGWYNFNIPRSVIPSLLKDSSWYSLEIPEDEMRLDSFDKVRQWEEIAECLLIAYMNRYYPYRKKEWELPHLEYVPVEDNNPNLLVREPPMEDGYRIRLNETDTELLAKLKELKKHIEDKKFDPWEFRGISSVWLSNHLYKPLLYMEHGTVEISPVSLNRGEKDFITDLKSFYENSADFFSGKKLYVLRNLSKGKGVGFFEAGNFFPDFILWLVIDKTQHVIFVDPKGVRNVGLDDPKVKFHETIKEIEGRLADSNVILNSFIVSNTPQHEVEYLRGVPREDMEKKHILFQKEDAQYVKKIFDTVLAG